ncbi:MAG: molybdopterin-binding protein [Pseudomonadota bacterium]
MEARVVADIEQDIIDAVNALRARYTYLFTTGGIGPTHDDITAATVAKAFGLALHRHPDALALMQRRYKNPADLTQGRLKMTEVPVGASLVDNPVSGAPGFQIGNVFVMAGIPAIARAMFDGLRHRLKGGPPMLARTVVSNLGEGLIATDLGTLQAQYPDVEIGSYPFHRRGVFGSSLVLRSYRPATARGRRRRGPRAGAPPGRRADRRADGVTPLAVAPRMGLKSPLGLRYTGTSAGVAKLVDATDLSD